MKLLRRQNTIRKEDLDDQDPAIWGSYVGNWSHYFSQGWANNTLTSTSTPGASISFTFSGVQLWVWGDVSNRTTAANNEVLNYPIVDYVVDGQNAGPQIPSMDGSGWIIHFITPQLANGTHTIDITVTAADERNKFILDDFTIGSIPDEPTSTNLPTCTAPPHNPSDSAKRSTLIGAAVAGGVAGIAIAVIGVWYYIKRRERRKERERRKTQGAPDSTSEGHAKPNGTASTPAAPRA